MQSIALATAFVLLAAPCGKKSHKLSVDVGSSYTLTPDVPIKSVSVTGDALDVAVIGDGLRIRAPSEGVQVLLLWGTGGERVRELVCANGKGDAAARELKQKLDLELCTLPGLIACTLEGKVGVYGEPESEADSAKLKEILKRFPAAENKVADD